MADEVRRIDLSVLKAALIMDRPYWSLYDQQEWGRYCNQRALEAIAGKRGIWNEQSE